MKKIKKHYKKIIILLVIILPISSYGAYKAFFVEEESKFSYSVAEISDLVQEVSVVGQAKKGEKINLSFESSGVIDSVSVKVGEVVEEGQRLISLESSQLYIQLQEARSALALAQAEYDKLIAGASAEEIEVAQTKVDNARAAYEIAKQALKNEQEEADNNLQAAYEDALNTLEDSYLKIYNAYNRVETIQRDYFGGNDQPSSAVKEEMERIGNEKTKAKTALDAAKTTSDSAVMDSSIAEIRDSLGIIYESLVNIRLTCEDPNYRNDVSSTDKTYLDNHKSYINTALTSVTDDQQTISSTKLSNRTSINAAEASLVTAEGNLKAAEDNLALVLADPRSEDIKLKKAQVNKAEASAELLKDKIEKTILKAPIDGQISEVGKELGEQVIAGEVAISLIPSEPFQVEVDVPEADVGKITVANPVEISLDAFPTEKFTGQVLEVNPAETIISGVVYYETKVSLDSEDSRIKPGMTANVVIITASRQGVLTIPARAVTEESMVKIMVNEEEYKEVKVETGVRGTDGKIEIVSGDIKEGDRVVTFIKK